MAELEFSLHPRQQEIWCDPARFKAVVAGRRFGKTHLLAVWLLIQALKDKNDRGYTLTTEQEVIYIAPTFAQAQRIFWPKLKVLAEPVIAHCLENTGVMTLTNGRRIRIFGMDNPDAARGGSYSAAGFDEYADMPERAWGEIVRPALMDVEGEAMFIGTPKGKNHFYKLICDAEDNPEWAAFNFSSAENPLLSAKELAGITKEMSSSQIRQEIEASFTASEGQVFKREWFKFDPEEPADGQWCVAVDLAGFKAAEGSSKREVKRLDDSAIAIVKNHREGWWVKEIRYGKWDTREAAFQIIKAAKDVQASQIGIEKGALANAVAPYLTDYMRQYGRYLHVIPLTHGNKRKADRIAWALQGRAEKGRIVLNPSGPWATKLVEQALDFPDPRPSVHDDLLDALAYVDQLAVGDYGDPYDPSQDQFTPLDAHAGY